MLPSIFFGRAACCAGAWGASPGPRFGVALATALRRRAARLHRRRGAEHDRPGCGERARRLAGPARRWRRRGGRHGRRPARHADLGHASRVLCGRSGPKREVRGHDPATGAGKAVGLPPDYEAALPGQIRLLLGSLSGPLLAQQTAANLHATVGSKVTIDRPGLGPVNVVVAGVVDLPNQDSMFQAVGLPAEPNRRRRPTTSCCCRRRNGARCSISRPRRVRAAPGQLHVRLEPASLPSDPVSAFADVLGRAKNLEVRIAGSGLIADNLAARLDATRSDALYARVLFLFLGAPGVAIAVLLTLAVAAAGHERRRREQALLRARAPIRGS